MTSQEIRRSFLSFFESKSHHILPSASVVIRNDPSLLFTNAGMNPFKDYFLGQKKSPHKRIADTQKCLRVAGKHNDLEDVGYDTYHHTMFEMLGNWSFGDYFKKEAIEWAWELLTQVYKIPYEDLYITVFAGDEKDALAPDEQARLCWEKIVEKDRIIACGKKDNFWEMGASGPCGPCSEIHVDLRSPQEKELIPAMKLINKDHPQVIELWNLVFMEFLRKADGSLEKLSSRHIDTGMGFERLCRVLQGKSSNYDTDIFLPLIRKVEQLSAAKYGKDSRVDVAIRVVVDHIRAIAFAIADGQNPSNTGAGYVIRRLLRRAVSYGYRFLHQKEAFLYKLPEILVKEMGEAFPELVNQKKWIEQQIKAEELAFLRTLSQGIKRMEAIVKETAGKKQKCIEGAKIFELYDTYGFPMDLSRLLATESALEIDERGFEKEMRLQRERSRKAGNIESDDWVVLKEMSSDGQEDFLGYDHLSVETYICRYRRIQTPKSVYYQIVLNSTPFYAEGGGQLGDSGYIENENERISVIDTRKENGLFLHIVQKLPEDPTLIFKAVVDENRRRNIEKSHSATHLLHYALRSVLGPHIAQKGSYVGPDRLRFDFSHAQKLSYEQLQAIENLVQEMIDKDLALQESRELSLEMALAQGAMALFGEKYGDKVRSIGFGPSLELCGGTHVTQSGEIGLFKVISESSVGSGIRRIEALTSKAALTYLKEANENYQAILSEMHHPADPLKALHKLQQENKSLRAQIELFTAKEIQHLKKEWWTKAQKRPAFDLICEKTHLSVSSIKTISLELRREHKRLILLIAHAEKNEATLHVAVSDALVDEGVDASYIIQKLLPYIKGKGGGQKFFAMGKGSAPEGLAEAFKRVNDFIPL